MKSFTEVSKYLFSCDGVKVLFSERFNQDPLESFFGKHRRRGGHCDNPTVKDFLINTMSLRIQGSLAKDPIRGNCRPTDSEELDIIDETPLPKRRKYSHES